MWRYQNIDELYHHGILGMKWGHRKWKARKERIRKARIADNDERVKTYGKNMVKTSNRIHMAITGITGARISKAIILRGQQACRKALNESGGEANAKTRAIGLSYLAAAGLVSGITAYNIKRRHDDNVLADDYINRKRAATEARKKAKATTKSNLTSKEQARLDILQKRVNNIKSESEYSHFENTKAGQEYRSLVIKEIKSRKRRR